MKNRGFSLVEAVISISILLIGVLGIASLGIAMVSQARLTNNQALATQLGREGVEVARAIRDGNWLIAEDGAYAAEFNDSLSAKNDYSASPEWDSTTNTWTLDFDTPGFGDCGYGFDCTRIYQRLKPPFEYAQFASAPSAADWQETSFHRVLFLFPICRSDADELVEHVLTADYSDCSAGESIAGIDIQAQVKWEERGLTKSVVVEEYIYDWKY